jgi:hypothetical protein
MLIAKRRSNANLSGLWPSRMVVLHPSFDASFLVDLIEVLAHRIVQRRMVILDRQDPGRIMRKTRLTVS